MRRLTFVVAVLLVARLAASSQQAPTRKGEVVELWPKAALTTAAGRPEQTTVVRTKAGRVITKVTNVTSPTLTIHRPAKAAKATAAVIICPGGGYGILAYDLEGTEVAEWLSSLGVAGIILKYRVPRQRDAAFQDAQRAVGLVRSRAKQWNIDPGRIGILGFSAGGHLAARACTNFGKRAYEAVDEADRVSCRPDFAVLVYPAYLATKGDAALDASALPVGPKTPSTFIAIAFNDKFALGALHYFTALRRAKAPSELHVFQFGGHGCGLRKAAANVTTWPEHCERWLRGIGAIPEKAGGSR